MRGRGILILLFMAGTLCAQEPTAGWDDGTEQITEPDAPLPDEEELSDAGWAYFRRHPVTLNRASAEELQQLQWLSAYQISQFLFYRKWMGPLVSRFELQAIPGWDLATIRKILPLVQLDEPWAMTQSWKDRLSGGSGRSLLRYGRSTPASYRTDSSSAYLGSPDRLLVRHDYQYQQLLQWGIAAEKDAGEPLFRNGVGRGFDFYSLNFLARRLGKIHTLALGDFTINMGQGLVQWQNLAFGKGSGGISVRRQAPLLKPYRSSGESQFYRGAAVVLKPGNWEVLIFGSGQRLDANIKWDTLLTGNSGITSLISGGYHRNPAELSDRKNLGLSTVGARVAFAWKQGRLGINNVTHRFSLPWLKGGQLYEKYDPQGRFFSNGSLDYSVTLRNMHVFGELACDGRGATACTAGILLSMHARLESSLLYRSFDPEYTVVYSSPFAENSRAVNERGCYAAVTFRPTTELQVTGYVDGYYFPWVRYRLMVPAWGRELGLQWTYHPSKKFQLEGRFRREAGLQSLPEYAGPLAAIGYQQKTQFRLQAHYQPDREWGVRIRMESVRMSFEGHPFPESGFLAFVDGRYAPSGASWRLQCRATVYETDSYGSRIYAFEGEGSTGLSNRVFYGKGFRWSGLFSLKPRGNLPIKGRGRPELGLKLGQSIGHFSPYIMDPAAAGGIRMRHSIDFNLQLLFHY